jgi:hypothetical protein
VGGEPLIQLSSCLKQNVHSMILKKKCPPYTPLGQNTINFNGDMTTAQ